jgi:hypothetical protein
MSIIRIGFSGPRGGMNQIQIQNLYTYLAQVALLNDHDPDVQGIEGRHGDCLGSDIAFHVLVTALRWRTVIHPPANDRYRAFCKGDEIRPPKPYLTRDWDIALETGELLATPDCPPRRGSGTWTTISYAIQLGRPVKMFFPDGTIGFGYEYADRLRAVLA